MRGEKRGRLSDILDGDRFGERCAALGFVPQAIEVSKARGGSSLDWAGGQRVDSNATRSCGELEVGAVVAGSPVPQAAAGVPCFGRFDNSGFFAECEHAEKRVSPLATEFAEVTHGRTE